MAGERDQHVTTALNTLERAVEGIQDSASFRAYLSAQAKFHRYSFRNVLLIMSQYPEATQVAGFNTWKNLDRNVIKGEKAIRILAPLKKKEVDDQGEERYRVFGYRAVPVFALEQTDGKPLPQVLVPQLMSDEGAELYGRLGALVKEDGYRLIDGSPRTDAVMGYTERQSKIVMVREDLSQLQRTKTLAHEYSHIVGDHYSSDPSTETEAEASAYVVLAHHGLDSGERSFPYVATWAQDKHVLRSALGNIQTISRTIIDRLNPQDKVLPVGGAE